MTTQVFYKDNKNHPFEQRVRELALDYQAKAADDFEFDIDGFRVLVGGFKSHEQAKAFQVELTRIANIFGIPVMFGGA